MEPTDEATQHGFLTRRIVRRHSSVDLAYRPPAPDSDNYGRNGFEILEIRMAFVCCVYSLLALQYLIVYGILAIFLRCTKKEWVGEHPGIHHFITFIACITLIGSLVYPKLKRKFPGNIISLILVPWAEGIIFATSFFRVEQFIIGVGFNIFICLSLVLFSFQNVWDFKGRTIWKFVFALILFVFVTLAIFKRGSIPFKELVAVTTAVTYFTSVSVFGMLKIIARKHRLDIKPEEYVFAAVTLY